MHRLTSRTILGTLAAVVAAAMLTAGCGEVPPPAAPPETPKAAGAKIVGMIELPEKYNTPDGMVLDAKTGDIILSCPNFNNHDHPAKMLRIDADDKITEITDLPPHPETKLVGPLGVDVGPDGNLYIADNQTFFDRTDHQSRLLRVVMKDGKAQGCEVLVTGFIMSNAVACHGDSVYVTESKLDVKAAPMPSGVYRFTFAELDPAKPIQLEPGGTDPHLVLKLETQNPDWVGANGMGFDAQGNMFVCNFGDAQLIKVTFDAQGKVASQEVFAEGQGMKSADGLKVHPKTGDIYIADFLGNAVHKVDAKTGKVTTLAQNGLTDGAGGALDRCSEVCLRGNKVYAANIDLPLADNEFDSPHSISIIELAE